MSMPASSWRRCRPPAPLMAAITGLGSAWIASVTRPPVSRTPSWYGASVEVGAQVLGRGRSDSSRPKTLPSAERSMPAQNARPAPVTTTARTSSSRASVRKNLLQLAGHRQVEGVERVGPVQGQRGDAVVVDRPVEGLVVVMRGVYP